MPRKFITTLFVFSFLTLIPNSGFCLCSPPNSNDYSVGGTVYVGWPDYIFDQPHYLLIQNSSRNTFENVRVTFPYQQADASYDSYWPTTVQKLQQVCLNSVHGPKTIPVYYRRVTEDPPYPDLQCSNHNVTIVQDIEPNQSVSIPFPPHEAAAFDFTAFYELSSPEEVLCCSEVDEHDPTQCKTVYVEEVIPDPPEITYKLSTCYWDHIEVTGDNIVTGGSLLGCNFFNPFFDAWQIDAGESFPVWLYSPKDTKVRITPSVETAKPGEKVTLTIQYENLTDHDLDNVVITASIPEHAVYVEGSAGEISGSAPVYDPDSNQLEWYLGTVAPHAQGQGTFEIEIGTCMPPDVTGIAGEARIWVNGEINAADPFTVDVQTMELRLDVQEKSANAGDILHYTIHLKNLLDCDLSWDDPAVTLTLPIPDMHLGVSFESADQGGQFHADSVQWRVPFIAAGEEATFHAELRVPDPVPEDLLVIATQASITIPPWGKLQNSNSVRTILGRYVIWGWVNDVEPYFLEKDDHGNPSPKSVYYHFKSIAPLPGANLELWKNGQPVSSTQSTDDYEGNYFIAVSEPGIYTLKARAETAIGEFVYEKEVEFQDGEGSQSIQVDFHFPVTLIQLESTLIQEMQEIDVLIKSMLQLISHRDDPEVNNAVNLILQGKFYFKYDMEKAQSYLEYLKDYNESRHPEDIDQGQTENLARLVGAHTFLYHQAVDAAAMADDLAKNISLLIAMYSASNTAKTPVKWLNQFVSDRFPQWKNLLSSTQGIPLDKLAGMDRPLIDTGQILSKISRITTFVSANEIYKFFFKEPPIQDVEARQQYLAWKDTLFFALRFLTAPFVNRLIGDVDFEIAFLAARSILDWGLMSLYICSTQPFVDDAVEKAYLEYPDGTHEDALQELHALDTELRSTSRAVHATVRDLSAYISYVRAINGGIKIWTTPPQQMPYFRDELIALKNGLLGRQNLNSVTAGSLYTLAAQLGVQGTIGLFSFGQFIRLAVSDKEGFEIAFSQNPGERQGATYSLLQPRALKQNFPRGEFPEAEDYRTTLAAVLDGFSTDPFDTAKGMLLELLDADRALSNGLATVYNKVVSAPPGLIQDSQLLDIHVAYFDFSEQRAVLYSLILAYLLDPAEGNLNEIVEQAGLVLEANELVSGRLSAVEPLLQGVVTNPFIMIASFEAPRSICAGIPMIVTATVENVGDRPAEDVEIEMEVEQRINLLSEPIQVIGTLGPHEWATVDWQITRTDLQPSFASVVVTGSNVNDAYDFDLIIAEIDDVDKDGLPNCWEVTNNLNPHDESDATSDPDSDKLPSMDEYAHQTNPQNPDTDGDHIPDGSEVELGLDPLAPNECTLGNIGDLTAFRTSSSSVSLTFTAPGYNGLGRANGYELRYATTLITEANWASATDAYGEQTPLAAGTQESITVRGLEGNTTYYFAIKAIDYEGKATTLSNVVTARTVGVPDWTREPDPVVAPGGAEDFDAMGVYHPAVIYDTTDPAYPDGVYKMWYSGVCMGLTDDGTVEQYQRIGYAVSPDGITWTKVPGTETGGSVIDVSTVDGFIEVRIISPAVIKDDTEPNPAARYKLWYYQYGGWGEPRSNGLIYCTSPDGIHWTKIGKVFGRSAIQGRFDENSAYFPSILMDFSEPDPSARYKMWYTGIAASGDYGIGYATSPDGVNWTRIDGPNADKSVLGKGLPGSFDATRVWTPSVIKNGDTYVLFYAGRGPRSYSQDGSGAGEQINTIGYATSKDGIFWEKGASSGPGGCSLDAGTAGHFDEAEVLTPSIAWDRNTLKMWYGAASGTGLRHIGHATASSGLSSLLSLKFVVRGEIGPEGGMVSVNDPTSPISGAAAIVPAGVLETVTTITIGEFTGSLPPLPEGLTGIGAAIHFGPEGIDFSPHRVTIVIPYTPEALAQAGIEDPHQLAVYTFSSITGQWELVSGSKTVDTVNNLIMIEVSHFSVFRLAAGSPTLTEKTICSVLGFDDSRFFPDVDAFKFHGTKGERITVRLEASPPENAAGKRAVLMLTGDRVQSFKIDASKLPNRIKAKLPATGEYFIAVSEYPEVVKGKGAKGKSYKGNYCVTLEASPEALGSFVPAFWVE